MHRRHCYRSQCILIPLLLIAITTNCARRAGPPTWRYIKQDSRTTLIPPGLANAAVAQRTFIFPTAAPREPACTLSENGIEIRRHKKGLRITVHREPLLQAPPGWLATWTGSLEPRHCLNPGEGLMLANRIAEALPLDPTVANALLHPDSRRSGFVDLGPHHRLKVVSPILREGAPASGGSALETATPSGNDRTLTIEAKSSAAFLGYETAWWALESRPDRIGVRIVPFSAEASIAGNLTVEPKPRFNYFRFGPEAAYFRMFFLTRVSRADHDIAILAAPTRAELDQHTPALQDNPASCVDNAAAMCMAIPQEVAVVPHLVVSMNGKEIAIPGGSLRDALKDAGVKQPDTVLPSLIIRKSYFGVLAPIDFDRTQNAILGLPLNGGEDIRFAGPSTPRP